MTKPRPSAGLSAAFGAALAAILPQAHAQTVTQGGAPPILTATPIRITISFHNAEAADVLRAVALQTGTSIAIAPGVKGKIISVRLLRVGPEEAIRLISQTAGLDYRRVGRTYIVGTAQDLKTARGVGSAQPYTLKNISSTVAKGLLEGTLPYLTVQTAEGEATVILSGSPEDVEQAKHLLELADQPSRPLSEVVTPAHVTANFLQSVLRRALPEMTLDVQGNSLVATGSRDNLARLKAMLPALDIEAAASKRAEVYTIQYSSARSLEEMLKAAIPGLTATPSAEPYAPPTALFRPLTSTGFGTGGGTGTGVGAGASGGMGTAVASTGDQGGVSVVKSRYLILSGPDTAVEQALQLLKTIDVSPTQVEIEVRIVDVSLDGSLNAGIQWGGLQEQNSTGGGSGGTTTKIFTPGAAQNPITETSVSGAINFGRFQRSPLDLAAQLNFLETKGRSKTLAHPSISVVDNEDANIFIGQIRRFQILASSSATAGNAFTVQELPVGVALLVRPRVNAMDEITMKVHPVVSTLLNSTDSTALPQTASREADTTLRVKDGETIVIGGLIRDDDIKSLQEVPLLSRIPLFGELFRNRTSTRQRSEVLIFLTPHLLKDGGQARKNAALDAATNAANALKSEKSGKIDR